MRYESFVTESPLYSIKERTVKANAVLLPFFIAALSKPEVAFRQLTRRRPIHLKRLRCVRIRNKNTEQRGAALAGRTERHP
jgi:hypothetical protein